MEDEGTEFGWTLLAYFACSKVETLGFDTTMLVKSNMESEKYIIKTKAL